MTGTARPARQPDTVADLLGEARGILRAARRMAVSAAQHLHADDAAALLAEVEALRRAARPDGDFAAVVQAVARAWDVTPADILSSSKAGGLPRARWAVMHILRRRGTPLAEIGRLMGMDHSSVMHGLHRLAEITGPAERECVFRSRRARAGEGEVEGTTCTN